MVEWGIGKGAREDLFRLRYRGIVFEVIAPEERAVRLGDSDSYSRNMPVIAIYANDANLTCLLGTTIIRILTATIRARSVIKAYNDTEPSVVEKNKSGAVA
jgi:hypothetical protein